MGFMSRAPSPDRARLFISGMLGAEVDGRVFQLGARTISFSRAAEQRRDRLTPRRMKREYGWTIRQIVLCAQMCGLGRLDKLSH